MMEWLVDTGILLRLVNRSDPLHETVVAATRILHRRGDSFVTTYQNIAEFWNVSTRPAEARGGYGRTVRDASHCVDFFERLGTILPDQPAAYVQWRQLITTHGVTGVSVHDARLVALMMVSSISHIFTLDAADFHRYAHITAVPPQSVLSQL